jgi:hypothetical protein
LLSAKPNHIINKHGMSVTIGLHGLLFVAAVAAVITCWMVFSLVATAFHYKVPWCGLRLVKVGINWGL